MSFSSMGFTNFWSAVQLYSDVEMWMGEKIVRNQKKTNVLASPFLDVEGKGDLESGNFYFTFIFLKDLWHARGLLAGGAPSRVHIHLLN